jgi:hypothetical protein
MVMQAMRTIRFYESRCRANAGVLVKGLEDVGLDVPATLSLRLMIEPGGGASVLEENSTAAVRLGPLLDDW